MALSTFVVIRNVSNLSDARYCAGMGADVLGFLLDPAAPAALSKPAFAEIAGWVAGVQLMGEFTRANAAEIALAATELGLDYVLLSQGFTLTDLRAIGLPVMLKVPYSTANELRQTFSGLSGGVAYFLVDLQGQTGLPEAETQALEQLAADFPVILTGEITAENVDRLLQQIKPKGICLQGGQEIKPGLRNFDELADILEKLETEV